ncbi:MAG: DMT family transporter [Planctomycetota bacterium]
MVRPWVPYASIAAGVLLWSTIEVAAKPITGAVPAGGIVVFRFVLGGLVVLPLGMRQARLGGLRISWRFLSACALLGFVGVFCSIGLFHKALQYEEAGTAAALFCSHPIWVAALAPLILKEAVGRWTFLGAFLGLAGVVTLSVGQIEAVPGAWLGVLMTVLSGLLFALYTVLLKRFHYARATILAFALSAVFGGVMMLPPVLLTTGAPEFLAALRSHAPTLLYLALVTTGAGYLLYFWGITHVSATSGSPFMYLKPVVAAALAKVLLGEPLRASLLVGVAFIVVGIALAVVGGPALPPGREVPTALDAVPFD